MRLLVIAALLASSIPALATNDGTIVYDSETALVMVDVQNDFMPYPGSTLPVPDGAQVVPELSKFVSKVAENHGALFATQDWHPAGHISFKSAGRGGIWPDHCIQGSHGSQLDDGLKVTLQAALEKEGVETQIVRKGYDLDHDAYSGFEGVNYQGLTLTQLLKQKHISRILVGGLATDYCVRATVLDGRKNGFEVVFLQSASRGVNVHAGDVTKAIEDMRKAGAIIAP